MATSFPAAKCSVLVHNFRLACRRRCGARLAKLKGSWVVNKCRAAVHAVGRGEPLPNERRARAALIRPAFDGRNAARFNIIISTS